MNPQGINVLSLFDGMSCGQIALKEAGIKVNNYFASEIDKHAIGQTQFNFPDTVQLGSVTEVHAADLPYIDLLIGGSPCQGFSFAGKQLNFNDPRSVLFFEFVRILKEIQEYNPGVLFLLENVRMKQEYERIITDYLGVEPVIINSSLVSAQNRVRLYWTNIRTREEVNLFDKIIYSDIPQPEDKKIYIGDILEDVVDPRYILSDKRIKKLLEHRERQKKNGTGFGFHPRKEDEKSNTLRVGGTCHDDIVILEGDRAIKCKGYLRLNSKGEAKKDQSKASCLTVGGHGAGNHSDTDIIIQYPRGANKGGCFSKKSPTITSNSWEQNNIIFSPQAPIYRRFTVKECSRLQTIPDWYEWKCSNSQAYKMLGNGWTIDVIKHIFSFINLTPEQ